METLRFFIAILLCIPVGTAASFYFMPDYGKKYPLLRLFSGIVVGLLSLLGLLFIAIPIMHRIEYKIVKAVAITTHIQGIKDTTIRDTVIYKP